jgi:hypothetical protein
MLLWGLSIPRLMLPFEPSSTELVLVPCVACLDNTHDTICCNRYCDTSWHIIHYVAQSRSNMPCLTQWCVLQAIRQAAVAVQGPSGRAGLCGSWSCCRTGSSIQCSFGWVCTATAKSGFTAPVCRLPALCVCVWTSHQDCQSALLC